MERPARTLILSPRHSEDSRLMRQAAARAGWRVVRLPGWRVAAAGPLPGPVAIYGEALFVEAIADQLGRALVQPALDWLARLPAPYRRRDVEFTTLAEARTRAGPLFIKPADTKCFAARVYPSGQALPRPAELPEDTPTLVSEPVEWALEFRCFVADRRVRARSIYARDGALAQRGGARPCAPEEERGALAFAEALLADAAVELPTSVVLDVGLIRGRGWAAVELNPAWGSGLYGCDPAGALAVIEDTVTTRAGAPAPDDSHMS
ncbi:MAG: ATP-grasp domain-containing protein [Myxococcales bacterium]|nr:ATP-grasp domain-containing protein [Myxococcales bacterium]